LLHMLINYQVGYAFALPLHKC